MLVKIIIFYIVTFFGAGLMGLLQPHLGLNENIIQLTQLGPTYGVLALLLIYKRKNIKLAIGSTKSFHPVVLRNLIGALLLPVIAFGLTLGIYALSGHWSSIDFIHPSKIAPSPYWVVCVLAFIGAACEEIGWRSWLQPFLETKYSVFNASLIVGVLWSVWHVGNFSFGLPFMGLFMVMAIAMSVVVAQLLRKARGNNLIIATSLHAMTNIYLLLFFNEEKGSTFAMGTIAIAWVVIALLVLGYKALGDRVSPRSSSRKAVATPTA